MKKFVWLVLGWLFPFVGVSQNITISGAILDSASGYPLEQASIMIYPDKLYALSQGNGTWSIPNITPGPKELKVTHIGCLSVYVRFYATSDTNLIIRLKHHVHVFEPHVVHGNRHENEQHTDHEKTLQGISLYSVQHLSLAEQLTSINGVYALKSGQGISKPVIRGLQGNRVVTIDHGQRLESQQWGSEHAPEIDGRSANSITVLKGASTLRYGSDALGGIVILDPGRISDSFHLNLMSSGHSNGWGGKIHGIIEFPLLKRGKVRIYSGLQGSGDQHTPGYSLTNTAFKAGSAGIIHQYNHKDRAVQRNVRFYFSKPGILKASHIGNITDLQKAIQGNEPLIQEDFSYNISNPFQKITHLSAVERQEYRKGLWKLIGQYGFQWNKRLEFDSRRGASADIPQLNFNLFTHQLEVNVLWNKGIHGIETGVQGYWQGNIQKGFLLIPNYRKRGLGVYNLYRLTTEKHLVECGIRGDWIDQTAYFYATSDVILKHRNFSGIAANLSWRYQLGHDWLWMVQASRLWRAPSVNELYSNGLHHGAAALEYGDPTLDKEIAHSLAMILVYNHNKFNFEIEPFIRRIENFMSLQPSLPTALTIRGAFPVFNFEARNVLFRGIDAQWEWAMFDHVFVKGQYSFMWVRDTAGLFLNGMPAPSFGHELRYKLEKWKGFYGIQAMLEYRYVLKQPFADGSNDYAGPPPSYGVMRSSLAFRNTAVKGLWMITFENVLNTRYRDYLSRLRYYVDEPAFNIIFSYMYTN